MQASTPELATVTIDGRTLETPKGATILDAARTLGIAIPTLCHLRGLSPWGACRVCLVELEGPRGATLVPACSYPVTGNLTVQTDTAAVRDSRQAVLELLLAQAPDSPELAEFAAGLGVESTPLEPDAEGKCVLCGLCVRVCQDLMGRGAINLFGRGAGREVRTASGEPTDQCQSCGACVFVCPTGAIDLKTIAARRPRPHLTEYDYHLNARPSIDLAHPQSAPRVPVIDRDSCVHLKTGECGLCAEVCGAGAIDYAQPERERDLEVGAVVLTPGFETFDATRRGEFGFGHAPNVMTNIQFERVLSASGPSAGHIVRPSDGKTPKRLAFLQCVGSRDTGCDNDYCSSVCCMAATKEAILAKDHEPDLDVTIFFLDLRAFGKDFDRYYERAQKLGIRYVRSFISRTYEMPRTRNLRLSYMSAERELVEEEFDLIVLSLGLEPSPSIKRQAELLGVELNRWGFARTRELAPLDTSRAGVFVGGAFQEPKDIPDTVMQASAAASRAMALLRDARGTEVKTKTYPPERDITDEPPRVGVFVCHCGSNIASVVDVEAVVARVKELPEVAHAETSVYACADDSQDHVKQLIGELRLNRIVIASCTPRTHEPIFRDSLRDAGLNQYLVEMANIRDQCSWVHAEDAPKATDKATDLVRMAVGRAARLQPLRDTTVPVKNGALIIGGGVAGLTAALTLAEQGFPVHLVESAAALGGTALRIPRTLEGDDVQAFLAQAIERVTASPLVTVHLNSRVANVDGHVGEFASTIANEQGKEQIEHGVVVVATGATERKPESYGYGESDKVITQLELSERLGGDELALPENATVVMIQCVEQRSAERPYCSRVCCTTAVKNALQLCERRPDVRVMVLYRDMRTYGFREAAYREAREKGVLFVRYDEARPPELKQNGAGLMLSVQEPSLGRELEVAPDLVALAAPIQGRDDRQEISELLRVPINADGYYLEAHMKLRPVDFASEGLFLCGTAHAPKFISETIAQASAVAARAAGILSRKVLPVSGQIAHVDPDKCISCMTCTHVCPYLAPTVGFNNKAEVQGAVCMGCGSCTAECPAHAIELRHFIDSQILGAIDNLLGTKPADEDDKFRGQAQKSNRRLCGLTSPSQSPNYNEKNYLEGVGVAPPRWRRE